MIEPHVYGAVHLEPTPQPQGIVMRSTPTTVAVLLLLAAGACAAPAPTVQTAAPPPDTIRVVDTVRVTTASPANAELEDRAGRLAIQVLEKEGQLRDLQTQLDATRLELVRNLARLQTQASRAEAASAMSEAEIALATLRRAPGASGLNDLAQAQGLFQQSSQEFARENYGGALYLATQSRALVRSGQARLRSGGGGELRAGETLFAAPVPLKTTGRVNVRSGPGTEFDVAFTVESSAALVGQSYTSQWVHIVDDTGRGGWIFHNLLTAR
jgi:hypothetical protein